MKTGHRPGIFYGWYIVAVAFVANFMATGSGFYIFNALMNPLCDQKGWTRTEINAAPVIGMAIGFLTTPLYGTLVTRVGPRVLMVLGSILCGIAFSCMGGVGRIEHFYFLFTLLFIGNGAMSGIVANTAVSNWFVRRRGRAMGLATAGISLSGAVLPYLGMRILEWTDLTFVFVCVGVMISMVAPLAWLVVRDRPERFGLKPDGEIEAEPSAPAGRSPSAPCPEPLSGDLSLQAVGGPDPDPVWSLSGMLRTEAFWKVGLAYALVLMGVVGVMFQLAPRFIDIGYDRRTAIFLISATALVGTAGKTAWGMLCDRFDPRRVAAVLMAMNGLGLAMALFQNSLAALILFVVVYGFAMGGVMSTFPILIADLFGRESFAQVARFLSLLLLLDAAGYLVMGQSFDRTGSYDPAYVMFIFLNIVAAGLMFSVKRPVRRPAGAPA